ncbi:hypothetical protein V8F06_005329 [Rhypophila decipiens]
MNRHTMQTALGRVVRTTPTNLTKTQCPSARRTLSTTRSNRSDEGKNPSGREKSAQAAAKLGKLVRPSPPTEFRRLNLDDSSGASAAAPRTGGGGPVDVRALGAKTTPAPGAKILNLRSLRAPGTTGRFAGAGARGGGAASGGGGPGLGRFANREGGGGEGAPSRFGGSRPGAGGGARGGRRPGGGSSRFGKRVFKPKPKEKKTDRLNDKPVDREWSAAEMQVLDRLDQGEYIRYNPQADLESLAGYGPALATDNTLGRVESALQAMRIMGGGRAFDNDPASTVATRAFSKRYYHDKEPVFVNTVGEKEWLEESMHTKLRGPLETVKEAVIETVIKGKYTAPEFKDLSDVTGLVANYQNREASYRASHCQEFSEKLVSILPKAKAAAGAAPK